MAMLCVRIRLIVTAMAIVIFAVAALPAAAQQPNSVDPTADAVKEQQLLQQFNRIQGLGQIPDTKSYVIEQPMGRVWRQFHEVWLHWIGAIAVLGMLALLIMFYLIRGMIRIRIRPLGREDCTLQCLRAFCALDDRDLFHHPRSYRAQRYVRQIRTASADGPERVLVMVAGGEVRAQLHQLPVHARRHPDFSHVAGGEYPQSRRRRVVQARRRHGRA